MHIDHADNDSTNDNPSNLRITTRKKNNSRKHARLMKRLNHKATNHSNEIVKANKDGQELLFKNGMEAARELGVSHVLVYRILNKSDYAKTAKGWVLEYVPLTYGILPENAKEI